MSQQLTEREIRFLALMYPNGTVEIGLSIGDSLRRRGFLCVTPKNHRLSLTRKGMIAVVASQHRKGPK